MYFAYVKKMNTDKGVDFFAHMVFADSEKEAKKRVEKDTKIIELIEIGSSSEEEKEELYEKACKKSLKLSGNRVQKVKTELEDTKKVEALIE